MKFDKKQKALIGGMLVVVILGVFLSIQMKELQKETDRMLSRCEILIDGDVNTSVNMD
jgi:hypothetical protein